MILLRLLPALTLCLSIFNYLPANEDSLLLENHLKVTEQLLNLDSDFFSDDHPGLSHHCGKPVELVYAVTLSQIGPAVTSTVTLNFISYVVDPKGRIHKGAPVSLDFPLPTGFSGLTLSPIKLKRHMRGSYTVGYFIQNSAGAFTETLALNLSGGVQAVFNKRVEYVPFSFFLAPYPILNVATVNISSQLVIPFPRIP